jgi:hypothetical protein
MSALGQSEHVFIDQNFKRINDLSTTLCMAECRNVCFHHTSEETTPAKLPWGAAFQ